ncbi:hypothetical protein HYT52_01515, partial [Candidatus Woesearchaeota archaeon]|nr:hypothetical protein [Candidatus Woesearchaeota archaeon]
MLKKRDHCFSRVSCFKRIDAIKSILLAHKISRKGQLTMFIILGVIILFIFLFLIQMSSQFVLQQLEQGSEDVFSKAFKKEGLRIFVEDCLEDELRDAIILSGKQARIWDDQPGGSLHFEAGFSGVQYLPDSENRIAYSLTNYNYLTSKNAYPCASEDNPPVFCQYFFPNTARFGEVQLWERNIEKDLENYLKIKAQECIDNYLNNLTANSPSVDFTSTDFKLSIDMQDDGILVQANYPLSFNVGGGDFFHLSVFDFFYPTKLRKMLRAVYFFPLEMDYRFADFYFSETPLTNPEFSYTKPDGTLATRPTFGSDYQSMEISMKRERIATEGESYGDTVYTFTSPFPHVLDAPDNYTLRFARKNRAPALDYVHRAECLAGDQPYDYLIVKGDENYGHMDIQLKAHDPDEDLFNEDGSGEEEIKYLFDNLGEFGDYFLPSMFTNSDETVSGEAEIEGTAILADQLIVSSQQMQDILIPQGEYSFTAKSRDKYGKEDWQEVRVFVDRPIEPERDLNVGINIPYWFKTSTSSKPYLEAMASDLFEDTYFISLEDPFFIEVAVPEDPLNPSAVEPGVSSITYTPLSASGVPSGTPINIPLPEDVNCLNLPGTSPAGSPTCDLSVYTQPLDNWLTATRPSNPNYQTMTPEFTILPNPKGKLNIGFSAQYCGSSEPITSEREVTVEVKQCLPNANPTHPLAYVPGLTKQYYQWVYNDENRLQYLADGLTPKTENINSLAATHACCNSDYTFKGIETSCFTSPEPSCENSIKGFGDDFQQGYVLSSAVYNCSGSRGNVCGENGASHYDFYSGSPDISTTKKLICGITGREGCVVRTGTGGTTNIDSKCAGKDAYSYIDSGTDGRIDGFCLGTMGCSEFCGDFGEELVLEVGTTEQVNNLNNYIITNFKIGEELDTVTKVHCGCSDADSVAGAQKRCDSNFDGTFEGKCRNRECVT